jgi:hypothetical protein
MRYHMKHMAALLIALCVCLPNGMALAAAAQEQRAVAEGQAPDRQNDKAGKETAAAEVARAAPDNRASLLHIVLAGAVLIVVGNMVISFAKRKMERDMEAAKEKADAEGQGKRS